MRIGVVRALAAAALLVTAGGAAQAQEVTISFRGTVSYAGSSDDTFPFPDIVAGTPFTGYFTYNLATPNTASAPYSSQVGEYWHTSAPSGVTVTIGNRTFRTNPGNVQLLVNVINDYFGRDNFVFHSYNNLDTGGVP